MSPVSSLLTMSPLYVSSLLTMSPLHVPCLLQVKSALRLPRRSLEEPDVSRPYKQTHGPRPGSSHSRRQRPGAQTKR